MPALVFLDLDNTFWTDDGVPASALEAVRRAQAKGHLVFSNTGRARSGTRPLEVYGFDGQCFSSGSEAYVHGRRIVNEPLGAEASRALCALLDRGEGIVIAEGGESCFVRAYDQATFDMVHDRCAITADPYIDWPDIAEMGDEDHAQVYKYTLWASRATLEAVQDELPPRYLSTIMGQAADYTQRHISKATVLETVRAAVEELRGEVFETIAFGDSGNDVPMLQAADVSVAMGNGCEEAKRVADHVAPHILDDGLLRGFESLGLI